MAKEICRDVLDTGATTDEVVRIATYAYVPTTDGDSAVSTKLVVAVEDIADTDWSDTPYQELVERAESYKFNHYLYD